MPRTMERNPLTGKFQRISPATMARIARERQSASRTAELAVRRNRAMRNGMKPAGAMTRTELASMVPSQRVAR